MSGKLHICRTLSGPMVALCGASYPQNDFTPRPLKPSGDMSKRVLEQLCSHCVRRHDAELRGLGIVATKPTNKGGRHGSSRKNR